MPPTTPRSVLLNWHLPGFVATQFSIDFKTLKFSNVGRLRIGCYAESNVRKDGEEEEVKWESGEKGRKLKNGNDLFARHLRSILFLPR